MAKPKGPPKCSKRAGHAEEQEIRSRQLHEEIARVNALLAAKILELREFEVRHHGHSNHCGVPAKPNGNDGFFT